MVSCTYFSLHSTPSTQQQSVWTELDNVSSWKTTTLFPNLSSILKLNQQLNPESLKLCIHVPFFFFFLTKLQHLSWHQFSTFYIYNFKNIYKKTRAYSHFSWRPIQGFLTYVMSYICKRVCYLWWQYNEHWLPEQICRRLPEMNRASNPDGT